MIENKSAPSELLSTQECTWSQRALNTSLLQIMSLQTPRGMFHCPLHGATGQLCRYRFDSSGKGSILPLKQTNNQTDFLTRTNFNPLHYLKPEGPDNVTVANYVPPNTEGHISLSTAWSCWPTGGHISLRPPTFLSS